MQCKQKAHLEKTYITLQIRKKNKINKNSKSNENNKIHEKHKT